MTQPPALCPFQEFDARRKLWFNPDGYAATTTDADAGVPKWRRAEFAISEQSISNTQSDSDYFSRTRKLVNHRSRIA